jgi:hypothetical protein
MLKSSAMDRRLFCKGLAAAAFSTGNVALGKAASAGAGNAYRLVAETDRTRILNAADGAGDTGDLKAAQVHEEVD